MSSDISRMLREADDAGRFVKLPKWAQARILLLEGRVVEKQRHIDELAKPAFHASGEITHGGYDRERHVEHGDHVTFYIDDGEGRKVPKYIQIRWRDVDRPELGIDIMGSDCIRIDPRAANVAWITLDRPELG